MTFEIQNVSESAGTMDDRQPHTNSFPPNKVCEKSIKATPYDPEYYENTVSLSDSLRLCTHDGWQGL